MERAKDASIVGIVAGTLGVDGYRAAIDRVRHLVRVFVVPEPTDTNYVVDDTCSPWPQVAMAGKKSYTFLVGKPNPAKLGNFPECEVGHPRGAIRGAAWRTRGPLYRLCDAF